MELIKIAKKYFDAQKGEKKIQSVDFIADTEGNTYLNDIEKYPHLFVLACIMDQQVKAEKAWEIPIKIAKCINSYEFVDFAKLTLEDCKVIFSKNKLHRFNDRQAKYFYEAIQKIKNEYQSYAANIWKDNPKSATLVLRFIEFEGVGIKIATMAANILVRQFKIKVEDKYSIDISPDVHIRKIFYRMGLINNRKNTEEIIYKARELNPDFPGIIDLATWKVGREYCFEKNPNCLECPIRQDCKKKIG